MLFSGLFWFRSWLMELLVVDGGLAASLAAESTASLPGMPRWAGIHRKCTSSPLVMSSSNVPRSSMSMNCPEVFPGFRSVFRALWLSVKMTNLLCSGLEWAIRTSKARRMVQFSRVHSTLGVSAHHTITGYEIARPMECFASPLHTA